MVRVLWWSSRKSLILWLWQWSMTLWRCPCEVCFWFFEKNTGYAIISECVLLKGVCLFNFVFVIQPKKRNNLTFESILVKGTHPRVGHLDKSESDTKYASYTATVTVEQRSGQETVKHGFSPRIELVSGHCSCWVGINALNPMLLRSWIINLSSGIV